MVDGAAVALALGPGGEAGGCAEEGLQYLFDEWSRTDSTAIEREMDSAAPVGAWSSGPVQAGALLVRGGRCGARLPELIGLVRDSSHCVLGTLRLKVGAVGFELAQVPGEVQRGVLVEFLRCHEG